MTAVSISSSVASKASRKPSESFSVRQPIGQKQEPTEAANSELPRLSRRDSLHLVLGSLLSTQIAHSLTNPAFAALPAEVGTYLAPLEEGFVQFVPDAKKTPALRAGTINPNTPYRFDLPISFREGKVANILSGNFCQPRCDEPWTEVIFEDESSGRIALLVCPLRKLTNQANAKIDDVGPPEGILQSIGSYITGTFLDEDNVVSVDQKKQEDGRTYYYYEVDSPYGTLGRHSFSTCTTKGDLAYILVASANDKQWNKAKPELQKTVQSFRA